MAPPAELAVAPGPGAWAQSAPPKRRIDTIQKTNCNKTNCKRNAGKHADCQVGWSAENMELRFSLRDGNHKSFGLFLVEGRCKLLNRLAIKPASPSLPQLLPFGEYDLGHLVKPLPKVQSKMQVKPFPMAEDFPREDSAYERRTESNA